MSWDFQHEATALAFLAFDVDFTTMFTDDFLAHRQSQTRPMIAFGGFKKSEDFLKFRLGNSLAVIFDNDLGVLIGFVVFG